LKITDISKLIETIKNIKAKGSEIIYKKRDAGRLRVYSIRENELVVIGPIPVVEQIMEGVGNGK
jgi:hypothetical protein